MRTTRVEAERRLVRVSPPAPYVGGKRNLATRLVRLLEEIPHDCYAEPFFGMGGVFFRRKKAAKSEVVNDLSRDVITFFRILQRHYPFFLEMLRFGVVSRTIFEDMVDMDTSMLTDLERAARFFYLQRLSFGGKVRGRSFASSSGTGDRWRYHRLEEELGNVHSRLAGVIIECMSYEDFFRRYDHPRTLFYVDPPYWGTESIYGKEMFSRKDFERLAQILKGLRGRFVLSINDTMDTRRIFSDFSMVEIKTKYSLDSRKNGKLADELIVTNG